MKWKLNDPLATARQPRSQGFSLQNRRGRKSPGHEKPNFSPVPLLWTGFRPICCHLYLILSKLVRISKTKYRLKDLPLLMLLLTNLGHLTAWTESWISGSWSGDDQRGRKRVNMKNENCVFFSLQTCFLLNLVDLTILYGKRLIFRWQFEIMKFWNMKWIIFCIADKDMKVKMTIAVAIEWTSGRKGQG